MLQFHGKPFLEYLIELLREQGFSRILILVGYLPHVITEYFGDGNRFGVRIEYSKTAVENDTGLRVALARDKLDPIFLLMYSDNYWPMDFTTLWKAYLRSQAAAQVVVYRNRDGYTRHNLRVDGTGRVSVYDKSRQTADLEGVDIGFILMRRELLDLLPEGNTQLEKELYPRLIAKHELSAFVSDHRYYSVGGFDRLWMTEEFLRRRGMVLLDRDGVLNRRMPRAQYVTNWEQWEWEPGALESLRLLHGAGVRCVVVSNQPGIARGMLSQGALEELNRRMCSDAEAAGGRIEHVYYCPHGWDEGCECRKPRPGMLLQAQRDYHLDLSRTWFIGDDERDGAAARAAQCKFAMVTPKNSLLKIILELVASDFQPAGTGSSLSRKSDRLDGDPQSSRV
jgi:D-glycero-D-manno-heptose 1,7-bisphosphate phosphatase